MSGPLATLPDADPDVRWRDWQARGVEADRRMAVAARVVGLLVLLALMAWFLVQLA